MTKFIVNNRTDASKTDVNLFFTICPLSLADVSHEFQIHASVSIWTIKINQWARVNFCSYRKKHIRSNNDYVMWSRKHEIYKNSIVQESKVRLFSSTVQLFLSEFNLVRLPNSIDWTQFRVRFSSINLDWNTFWCLVGLRVD